MLSWPDILVRAEQIVRSYETSVTLRQLFYRLVSEHALPNTRNAYNALSAQSAKARRAGWFPRLIDRTREIHEPLTFSSPEDAVDWVRYRYRRDRSEGQDYQLYLAIEKAGIVEQLLQWFGYPLGLPVLSLGGYTSESYIAEIADRVDEDLRPAVLLYAGDYDPSGLDIERDFLARCPVFATVERVALTLDQIADYNLPPLPGKATDSRAAGFIEAHGQLFQVEVDALAPEDLRGLFETAIDRYYDHDVLADLLEVEERERGSIRVA